MVDIFEEVEEQERAERWRALIRKYAPWALGALAAVVLVGLGFWGWSAYQANAAAKGSEAYARGLEALQRGDVAAADAAFAEAIKSGSDAYESLALQQQAGVALNDGKAAEAAALLDRAAEASKHPLLSDAARLKAAFVLMDTASYDVVRERLQPLTEEGRPYRMAAREALGMAKLAAGKGREARDDFVFLSSSLDSPEGMKQRAQAAIQAIDSGSAARLPALAQAAAALPPQSPNILSPAPAGVPAAQAGAAR